MKILAEHATEFLSMYDGRHWTNAAGDEVDSKCFVSRVRMAEEEDKLGERDLASMSELMPPVSVMPQGNVGTPTQFFLDAVQQCRLPARIIAKLKLEFPRSRRRRVYGSVPFKYSSLGPKDGGDNDGGRKVYLERRRREEKERRGPENSAAKDESGSDDDDDTCEEWERHEALHDDVQARRADMSGDISQQPGTKERLFEEEMEVTWDKGSSGLVFYTDAQVWREAEGDFDEQTTDDWDVDMSVHYGGEGDKDARDSADMRQSVFHRKGKTDSVFKRPRRKNDQGKAASGKIGQFEKHTRGFGRKIMEKQGWKDGQGLGSTFPGMATALDNDGQTGRAGLGYYGEKIGTFAYPKAVSAVKPRIRKSIRDVIISTAYDDASKVDPGEELHRRNPQNYLSHRK